jgi:hypothetical protein
MLAFPLTQAQAHLEQNHSSFGESLAFPFAQAQAHLEHHPTMRES